MDFLKKIAICIAVILWAGGLIGGLVLSITAKSVAMVAATVVLGAFSFPTVKKLVTKNE
jgi:hypothetical protein